MVEFFTEGPGPGAYNVKSTFGAACRAVFQAAMAITEDDYYSDRLPQRPQVADVSPFEATFKFPKGPRSVRGRDPYFV